MPSSCPLHQSICGAPGGGGGGDGGEKSASSYSCHGAFQGRKMDLTLSFLHSVSLTFKVRLQGTVGKTPSRDLRYQMVFRQWVSVRTGAPEDAASPRHAEDFLLRQLLRALRRLLLLPGPGRSGGGSSGRRQRLWELRCAGPGVPPPAQLPVGGPPGRGLVPALRVLPAGPGQRRGPAAAAGQDQGAERQLHEAQPAA